MTNIIQVVGYKNAGKTTLVENMVRALTEAGYAVGTVKHDGHRFDIDHEGTDTWRHREAGASMTAITSANRTVMMEEKPVELSALVQRMATMDIVVVEGFKQEAYPKIVIVRREADKELLDNLSHIAAVVTWLPDIAFEGPIFSINRPDELLAWYTQQLPSPR
ncbi:molybdopterin-guanine dinucleotide biosynthesis protein MobB [Paenibacillus sp. CCS19]|uniref:molybdopterin-guanine dinucleotide biosynthesis protein B n=1 Tax=Paenibacillus sp. CCS19 TaxID=3158387 RepID=UPI002560A638|nr:molybdopterin-guanine dinucleotide biosynthesis protein B [Paenibacillus cellulosilyticus]GMK41540.1 molybdopterin-guanine dinucleotide biosynthesis protein MobB [Paenibacillus cellulosilyticus]